MGQVLIDDYGFGEIVVGGRFFESDLIITPSGVKSDWWRLEGHRLQLADVRDYLLEKADYVVIGTGYYGRMSVDDEVVKAFEEAGKKVIIANTREAVRKYNELVSRGFRVIAFLHLTC